MLRGLRILSLFSGYGGLDLGLERAGIGRTVAHAEIDPWCREVLRRHWPDAVQFNDVREVTRGADGVAGVDLVCGGFPCQPVSVAGTRLAQADPRWLWPEFARVLSELEPAFVVVENVPGLRTAGLRDVLADLAALGFDAEWTCFRAWNYGAPHLRDRLWLCAAHPHRAVVRDQPGWLWRAIERLASTDGRGAGEGVGRADANGLALSEQGPTRELAGDRASESAYSDAVRRLEQARRVAIQRGWAERCGWTLDPAPRVDDGPTDGLARGGRERARKAAGNGVVVPCAQAVGEALSEACELRARAEAA